MNKNIILNVFIYLLYLSSVIARGRRRGGLSHLHIKKIHINDKTIGRGLLKGLHVAEKAAASGALGPEFKAAAIAAETAETAIRGIIKGESAKQIAEESAMTTAGALVGGGMKEKLLRIVAKKIGISVPPQTGSKDTNFSSKLMNKVKRKLEQHGINDPTAHIKEMMTEHIKDNMHEFMPSHAIDHHDEDHHNYGHMHNHVVNVKTNLLAETHNYGKTQVHINPEIKINSIISQQPATVIDPIPDANSSKKIDLDSDSNTPNLMKAPSTEYFPFLSPYIFDQNPSFLQSNSLASMQYYQNPYMYSQYPSINGQYQYFSKNNQYPTIYDQNFYN